MSAVLDPISLSIDAVVTRLQGHFPEGRWHYSEQPDTMSPAQFKRMIARCPHIALGWGGFQGDAKGQRRFKGELGLRIWIVVKNPKTEDRLRGDARGPGLYPSATLATQLLQGLSIDGVGSLTVKSVAPAYAQGFVDDDISVAMIDCAIHAQLGDVAGAVDALPPFAGLRVDWELARAEGNADAPDAQDDIALNTTDTNGDA
jgi:hypothetical protein